MDYIEAFGNLKTSGRRDSKAVYKAVLLLAVIDMYEHCIIDRNEIVFNRELKSRFEEMWKKVLPNNATLFPDACMAFWYLQEEKFWHIVPVYGMEYILEDPVLNRDIPSESVFEKSVRYAELDEDLFFLMTLPSGRMGLRKVLLENYSELSDKAIDTMSVSEDNNVDCSVSAIDEYERMLSSVDSRSADEAEERIVAFENLSDDFQIALNLAYYTFLKNHRECRGMFRQLCPSVCELYTCIENGEVQHSDMSFMQKSVYEDFLVDLKMSLLDEDNSMAFIDKINLALSALHCEDTQDNNLEEHYEEEKDSSVVDVLPDTEKECINAETTPVVNRHGFSWTEYEEELVSLYFKQGRSIEDIASSVGRTVVAIKMRLANLGLIAYKYGDEDAGEKTEKASESEALPGFSIENSGIHCSIFNEWGERVFRTDGRFKVLNGKPYRLNYKSVCFTIKGMECNNGIWVKGGKKIVAYEQSDLYKILNKASYDAQIEDIVEGGCIEDNKVKVDGVWYDFDGYRINGEDNAVNLPVEEYSHVLCDGEFIPKGKLKDIDNIVKSPYDYLWIIAMVDMIADNPEKTMMSLDNLACMMIAEAWNIFYCYPELGNNEKMSELRKAMAFLADESKMYMDEALVPQTSREMVYAAIKDYPMAGDFEDAVDAMLDDAPYDILKAWLKSDGADLVMDSTNFANACLYALHLGGKDQYVEINKSWIRYLYAEHEKLRDYFMSHFVSYINGDDAHLQ